MTATGHRTATFDAIVIGGGHNGLVCAAYLARAGLRTVVLERRASVGGTLVTSEILSGARVPAVTHLVGNLRAVVVRELGLSGAGLRLVQPQALATSVRPDGPPITLWADPARTVADLGLHARRDAAAWTEIDARTRALARIVDRMAGMTPPDPSHVGVPDALAAARLGMRYRGLRTADARALLRWLPMPIGDLLEDHFETDALRALLAVRGIRFSSLGPRAAGTTQLLLADSAGSDSGLAGSTVYARGGPGALAAALATAASRLGVEIRTSAEVVAVRERNGRVTGVALASGEELSSPVVVGGIDPKRLLLGLVDPEALGPQLGWQVANVRMRGVIAKVNLALSDLPRFSGLEKDEDRIRLRGRIVVAPSVGYLDRAADAAKYGRISEEPWLEATIPSLVDPLLVDGAARSGVRHVMSVLLQSAPYSLRDGDWDANRDALGDLAVRALETVAPGIGALVVAREVITPADLERDYGLTGGHPLHGEAALDQWFAWRPMLGWARYRMPVDGLYLCGAGAHPGTGVTGLPGRNAAREIVADRRR